MRKKKEEEDRAEKKRERDELQQEKRRKARSELGSIRQVPEDSGAKRSSSSVRSHSGISRTGLSQEEKYIKDGNLAESCEEKLVRNDAQLALCQPTSNLITLDTASALEEEVGDGADSVEVVSGSSKEGDDARVTTSHGVIDPNSGEPFGETTAHESEGEDVSDEELEDELEEGKITSKHLDEGWRIRNSVRLHKEIHERILEIKTTPFLEERPSQGFAEECR